MLLSGGTWVIQMVQPQNGLEGTVQSTLLPPGSVKQVTSPIEPQFPTSLPYNVLYNVWGVPCLGADLSQPGKLYPNPPLTTLAKGAPPRPAALSCRGDPDGPTLPSPIHCPLYAPGGQTNMSQVQPLPLLKAPQRLPRVLRMKSTCLIMAFQAPMGHPPMTQRPSALLPALRPLGSSG